MKRNKIEEALVEVRDEYIAEAAGVKKKPRFAPWIGAVAAILVVCICVGVLWRPGSTAIDPTAATTLPGSYIRPGLHLTYAIVTPEYPKLALHPNEDDPAYLDGYKAWSDDQRALHNQPDGYADSLSAYFPRLTAQLLGNGEGENAVCAPLNTYLALAMLAEITAGDSQKQILDLLNAESAETLRTQAGQVWKAHYNDDGRSTSILGSSLWLNDRCTCNEETAQTLADSYYASVFRGNLGSTEMNEALRSWLSEQTGGMLDDYIATVGMKPETELTLATTIYYSVRWHKAFEEKYNTEGIFHGTAGDTNETYMNQTTSDSYYWGDRFESIDLFLQDGSTMWLFLPREGTTPEQLMSDGDISDFLAQKPSIPNSSYENQKRVVLHLSLPKFEIGSDRDIAEDLWALGLTDVFIPGAADFSPILPDADAASHISTVRHAAKVGIDESGVTGAAYTLLQLDGGIGRPDDEVYLTFDRPFAFVIESRDGLPLFAGIVNQP